jgi:hypothetical protein
MQALADAAHQQKQQYSSLKQSSRAAEQQKSTADMQW